MPKIWGKNEEYPLFQNIWVCLFFWFSMIDSIFVKLHNIWVPNPSLINNMSSLQMICIGICRVIHYRVRNSKSNFEIPAFFDVWKRNFKRQKIQNTKIFWLYNIYIFSLTSSFKSPKKVRISKSFILFFSLPC